MNEDLYLKKLEQREIKPTAIRLLILKTMMQHKEAFSLLDLENDLDTVDKSTIYRTITLFLTHHLIHAIDDGSGSLKYAVCSNDCNCEVLAGKADRAPAAVLLALCAAVGLNVAHASLPAVSVPLGVICLRCSAVLLSFHFQKLHLLTRRRRIGHIPGPRPFH